MSPQGRDRGPLAAVEGGPVNAAAQPAPELALPTLPPGRAGVPGALTRPRRGEQAAIRPSRFVPRPDRPARAGCPGAARVPRPRRGDRSAAPRRLRRLARLGARARCGLARRAEDGYQPRSQQDEDDRGHDEHRGKRHGRTRVRQEIPFLRRQAAGCCSRSPPGTGHRGRSGSRRPGCAAPRVATVMGRAAQRSGIPPQTCISS